MRIYLNPLTIAVLLFVQAARLIVFYRCNRLLNRQNRDHRKIEIF